MHSVTDFLPRQTTSPLARRLALHQRLLAETRRVLPSYLRDQCQVCWINNRNQLILQVTGPEYAAQIRFFIVAILDAVRKVAGEEVRRVLIRAAVPEARTVPPRAVTTQSTVRLLAKEANICSVPEIGQALGRLVAAMASHCEKAGKKNPSQLS